MLVARVVPLLFVAVHGFGSVPDSPVVPYIVPCPVPGTCQYPAVAPPDPLATAVYHWVEELGENTALPTFEECLASMTHHYSEDATFDLYAFGQPSGLDQTVGNVNITSTLCYLLALKDQPLGAMSIETCGSTVRGTFGPFAHGAFFETATGGLAPAAVVEEYARAFIIKGHLDETGRFVADEDHTCIGFCDLDYEWDC